MSDGICDVFGDACGLSLCLCGCLVLYIMCCIGSSDFVTGCWSQDLSLQLYSVAGNHARAHVVNDYDLKEKGCTCEVHVFMTVCFAWSCVSGWM